MNLIKQEFDYIIAGSGCAGLSLLYRILNEPILHKKRILVIDKSTKTKNDRTWCYWEEGNGLFEPIVHHQWKTLTFYGSDFKEVFDLKKYSYKMIRGIDFYNHVLSFARSFKNVVFVHDQIENMECDTNEAIVETGTYRYSSEFIFNSTPLFYPKMDTKNTLLQHFEGWVITTKEEVFNDKVGTLMDFRLDQKNGATFMYVLPTKPNETLIEYTLFSPAVLDDNAYKKAIENYIKYELKISEYEIAHTEKGIIPMSLAKFKRNQSSKNRIINLGTAGGFTKGSSGYTFQFIQKNTKDIVKNLATGNSPIQKMTFRDKMFQWYDRTLLDVLLSKKLTGKDIFSKMFKKLPPEKILVFLGNESTLIDEVKIMSSLPIAPFLSSGIKQLK